MLRELLDMHLLEDFARGLARSSGLRVGVHDARGGLIIASEPASEFARLTGTVLRTIPAGLTLVPVLAHDPPAAVAYVCERGVQYVAAPVPLDEQPVGWVTVGEFREASPAGATWEQLAAAAGTDLLKVVEAWQRLPVLDRRDAGQPVVVARWGARLLAEWCRRESRVIAASEETALVGDIAQLLTGQQELQAVLDRIVSETARVMRCRFCSLRLYDPGSGALTVKAVHNLPRRYLEKGPVLRSQSPIDDEALSGKVVYVQDAANDPRVQYPDEMVREGIVSMLTAGMLYRGTPVGVIRVYTDRPRRFRQTQRDLLRAVAHQAAMALVHARLVEDCLRAAATERQLALAGALQARMMLVPPPEQPGLATARVYQPTSHLGGDFCDIFTLPDGRLAAVVADVVGKGIPAAILSASVRGALRATAEECGDLEQLVARLNRQVFRETRTAEFVTLLLAAVDRPRGVLSVVSAGHEPPLLLRDGQVRRLADGDGVLGVFQEQTYRAQQVPLRPQDLLLLFTDGACDAANFAGELFGRQRLMESLRQHGHLAVDQVLHNILWDIRRFAGLAEQTDDLTMVGIRVLDRPG